MSKNNGLIVNHEVGVLNILVTLRLLVALLTDGRMLGLLLAGDTVMLH